MGSSSLENLSMIISSLAAFSFFFMYILYLRRRRRTRPSPPPPSPHPKLPIIGHLHLLLTDEMPHVKFAGLAKQLGPIFSLQLGQVHTVVISSPKLAELVLKAHDHVMANRPQLISAQYLSFGCSDVTFSPYGPYWRQARKICVTELLSPKRVSSFQLIRNEEVNRMLAAVSAQSGGGGGSETDVSEMLFKLANDVLCRVAFGKRFIAEEMSGLIKVLTETQALLAGFCVGDFFPGWEWVNSVSGTKRRLTENLKDLRMVCDEIINEHINAAAAAARKKEVEGNGGVKGEMMMKEDFVDVLLRVQKQDDLEVPITDDNLKALVLDMFVAGTDTSSATLEWTMTELARHQWIMKRAQDEVRQVASKKGKVEESDLPQLHFLKAIIKETMRLHPPVPLLVPRESMATCTLDGYEIPAKTRVLINTYAIGRDQESWENPLEYNPDRFMDADIDFRGGHDFRFLPFGGGRRGCPGYSFGLASIEISLARLLYHFDWALPQGVGPDDVDLSEIFGLATRKRSALKLVPTIQIPVPDN
ncbi:OLC1v1028758C1 [Oldenlandia corymbosa var. corymbosa]|uniref:OLC1v1028758C1 n=1 Tax=Oldenlandia corymbosa var. corymbosa TaxID=529605 RepID=A0AAV1CCG0_OLDCO|nr:OLC1v1028758C1 [Oldenlandia corymbosa var. corymbosa]